MAEKERALLVFMPNDDELDTLDIKMAELYELASTAGLDAVDHVVQKRRGNQRLLGSGKAEETALKAAAMDIDVVIFDDELSPSETRAMEDQLDTKVIDREALILDIFAQRARSREGKLQVEMAQLSWLLPRLTGKGKSLSRLGGGVGTRGPGETKLETDRRHIRRRLTHVKRELAQVVEQRKTQRAARRKLQYPYVVLVGYTNAGKSSLLNRLCESNIYVADQLFATLDPTTRRLVLPSGAVVFISDTVGFIRDLPPHLAIAFKATLEVLAEADMLLHVIDVSEPGFEERIDIVDRFINELNAGDIPRLYVYNKVDLLEEPPLLNHKLKQLPHCFTSATAVDGVTELIDALEDLATVPKFEADVFIPYRDKNSGRLLALAHEKGEVSMLISEETGTRFFLSGDARELATAFTPYIIEDQLNGAGEDGEKERNTR